MAKASSPNVEISSEDRARLDQVFMQLVLYVQSKAQEGQVKGQSELAAMFATEQIREVLQGCAMLIAGWNQGRIDGAGLDRTVRGLKALELPELAGQVSRLPYIAESEEGAAPDRL